MAGYSRWRYVYTEGAFLNSGPEEELKFTGNNSFGKVIFKFPSIKIIGLKISNISYTYGQYDFGKLQSIRVGMKF